MTAIYHITHLKNLPGIINAGGLWCDAKAATHCAVDIGYQDIKKRRASTPVPSSLGGVLADYVPFYFAPRSPMLFTISKGNVPQYQDGQDKVIYLVSSAEAVAGTGKSYCFTEGHAVMALTDFFDDLGRLSEVDWQVMGSQYWNDTDEQPDRKRRRQAEFLVHDHFPFELVDEIAVMNAGIAASVKAFLKDVQAAPSVAVRPAWYY